jgi:hypothetical protein
MDRQPSDYATNNKRWVTVVSALAVVPALTAIIIGASYWFHSLWLLDQAFPPATVLDRLVMYSIYGLSGTFFVLPLVAIAIFRRSPRIASVLLFGVSLLAASAVPFVHPNSYLFAILGTYVLAGAAAAWRGWILKPRLP